MKLHPSVPLALALAAGMAGTAVAQTPASPSTGMPAMPQSTTPDYGNTWNSQHPQSSYARQPSTYGTQQPAGYGQGQQAYRQPQQGYNPAQPSYGGTQANYAQPTANYGQPNSSSQMQQPWQPRQSAGAGSAQVREAQSQLQAAGLYKGPQDGLMDPDTRAAIARFQEQHGLRRTERLDQQTMAALTSNQATGSGSSAPSMNTSAPNAHAGQRTWQGTAPTGAGGNATGQPVPH